MNRKYFPFLKEWFDSPLRKPLVLRGARQVGKTWLVKAFAENQERRLIEVNFEKTPLLAKCFATNEPKEILLSLGTTLGEEIDPKGALLFLDEIQAYPELLAKLRWFAEDMPELPVIAAGSLLEFVLEKHTFSMPVGRIGYMYIEPLSFEEFLVASNQKILLEYLEGFDWTKKISEPTHERLLQFFKEYLLVGGMPEAVVSWTSRRSLQQVNQIHRNLINTYRDDFSKYSGRIDATRLDEVLTTLPKFLGEKIIYSKINPDLRSGQTKQAFELLNKARICYRITNTPGNGIPLAAGADSRFFKANLIDVGLASALLDLSLEDVASVSEIALINSGGIAEQVAGQLLRTLFPSYIDPSLYYWHREEAGASAEVDYILQHRMEVIPVEVKAGKTGSLKSLHYFMGKKGFKRAIRINSDFPSQVDVDVKDHSGTPIQYQLTSLPFYLIGQLHRLMGSYG